MGFDVISPAEQTCWNMSKKISKRFFRLMYVFEVAGVQ